MLTVSAARLPDDLEAVRALFAEYAEWTGVDLSFQDFGRELASLPGDYVPPRGALLLARLDGAKVGCVAMRPLAAGVCEMKRLYLRDAARGHGAGRALVAAIVETARAAGYQRMRLDTLPMMTAAIALYRACGFREIEPYRFNPVPGTLYFELGLSPSVKEPC
jgi:GNAT superfamily N-acetyltransferase